MADEDNIEIETDSLEIALLQTSCDPSDSATTTLESSSSLSGKSTVVGETSIAVDFSDSLPITQMHSASGPTLLRQAKSKHCASTESSPDISSNPSSCSIPKRQRTYSSSSSSTSSRYTNFIFSLFNILGDPQ